MLRWLLSILLLIVAILMVLNGNWFVGFIILLLGVGINPKVSENFHEENISNADASLRDNRDTRILTYEDAEGNITVREILVTSETDRYIHAIDVEVNEKRTFRQDRVISLSGQTQSSPKDKIPGQKPVSIKSKKWGKPKQNIAPSRQAHHIGEICFTGFSDKDKKRLTKVAEKANFLVRTRITKDLEYLCCGPTPGPSKVERAKERGIMLMNEEQFLHMATTGEILSDSMVKSQHN